MNKLNLKNHHHISAHIFGAIVLFLALLIFAIPQRIGAAEPSKFIGLGGGGFEIDTLISNGRLFTTVECGGVRMSDDGGITWREASRGIPKFGDIQRLWKDPFRINTIFVGQKGDILRSTDNGENWTIVKSVSNRPFADFAAKDTSTYFAVEGSRREMYGRAVGDKPSTSTAKIWKSTDGGLTWPTSIQVALTSTDDLPSIYIYPTTKNIYVAASTGGVRVSIDGGTTWNNFNEGLSHLTSRRLVADPAKPDIMYLTLGADSANPSKIYKWNITSRKWEDISGNLPADRDLFDIAVSQTSKVYVANFNPANGNGGIYRFDETIKSWVHLTRYNENMIHGWLGEIDWAKRPSGAAISIDPDNENIIYFTTPLRDQRFKTTDGGNTWQQIYAIKNTDGSWSNRGMGLVGAFAVTVDPQNPNKIFLGYGDWGTAVSIDGGNTWRRTMTNLGGYSDVNKILIDPVNSNNIWHVAGFRETTVTKYGVYYSNDGGNNWSLIGGGTSNINGLPGGYVRDVAIDPDTAPGSRTVYVVVEGKGVYKRIGQAGNWLRIDSTNLPNTTSADWPLRTIAFDPVRETIYVGFEKIGAGTGGVYKTTDGGAIWTLVTGTTGRSVSRGMYVNPSTGDLYFGTGNPVGGLYRFRFDNSSLEKLVADSKIQSVYLLAGTTRDKDVVYISGQDFPLAKWENYVFTNLMNLLPANVFARGEGVVYDVTTDTLYASMQCTGAYKIADVNPGLSQTLSVNLTADPTSGTAPLNDNLSADVSGTASGTISYSFWWNCNNTSTNVGTVEAACGTLPAPAAGSCSSNTSGLKCNSVNADPKTISHTYSSAGTYTAKVIAERGTALPTEARTTITVNPLLGSNKGFYPHSADVLSDPLVTGFFSGNTDWKNLEPTRGQFNWTVIDNAVNSARTAGKKVRIHLSGGVNAPSWLIGTTAPVSDVNKTCANNSPYNIPQFYVDPPNVPTYCAPYVWHPTYVSELTRFLTALGSYLNSKDAAYKSAIGGIYVPGGQNYSEMITCCGNASFNQAIAQEPKYTKSSYIAAIEQELNTIATSFPSEIRIIINLSQTWDETASTFTLNADVAKAVGDYAIQNYLARIDFQNASVPKTFQAVSDYLTTKKQSYPTLFISAQIGWNHLTDPASIGGTTVTVDELCVAYRVAYNFGARAIEVNNAAINNSILKIETQRWDQAFKDNAAAPACGGDTLSVDLKANASDGPITISYDTSATLSWASTNATSCTASGDWSGTKANSGSESTGNLTSNKTYTLTCTGPGGSSSDSVTVNVSDTTPPTISNVQATNITQTSATITWQTDEPATSQAEYGLTTDYGSNTTLDNNLVNSHSQILTSLSAGALYNFRVISKDGAGNESISINYNFTTLPLPDTTAPAKITNLTISNITETSVDLSWLSPGDDGNQGTAYQYDIRYSISPIADLNWNTATQVTGEPTPKSSGNTESFTLVGLNPSATYYFAIKTSDEIPNWSEISNVLSATTLTPPPTTLSVSLNANPSSGTAPLNRVDLTATVSGSTTGNINYTFYCNRSDTGTNITSSYAKKIDNTSQNPYTVNNACSYASPGQYSPKVIVERGAIVAEVRITLFVTEAPVNPPPGGGGGGSHIPPTTDTIPPQAPTNFQAQPGDSQVLLTWQNPPDSDFVGVRILRKTTSYPVSPTDGTLVYNGKKTSSVDTKLSNTQTYYYTIFAYDKVPNYSQGVTTQVIPTVGITSFSITQTAEKPISQMTIAELQAKITQLLSQIAALKAQLGQTQGTSEIPSTYQFTEPLYLGLKNNTDVRYLQTFLKNQGSDIYPQGLITGNFGSLTRSAVIKFQMKYQIIQSAYSPGAGLVGIKTRVKINEILGR